MTISELLDRFHAVASDPKAQLDAYLSAGEKVVLTAPVYTPEELIHAMGAVPMGAWGADLELQESKKYFPAFLCSIVQSITELGMRGVYDGVSAIVIPSLCDSLKVLGQNWKYAVPSIPFIPMTYPQRRETDYGIAFTRAGYERVIREVEAATGLTFSEEKLAASLAVYNEHNAAMRKLAAVLAGHSEITAQQRSDIFKSAFFLRKEEHTALVSELIDRLAEVQPGKEKVKILISGILTDAPALNEILDEYGMHIVFDDVAAQSRQYRVDSPDDGEPLDRLARKFASMGNCSLLYDPKKERIEMLIRAAADTGAKGILIVQTKFCDPEEFDSPLIRKACAAAGLPCAVIEADRQMVNYEQARTVVETFRDLLDA